MTVVVSKATPLDLSTAVPIRSLEAIDVAANIATAESNFARSAVTAEWLKSRLMLNRESLNLATLPPLRPFQVITCDSEKASRGTGMIKRGTYSSCGD